MATVKLSGVIVRNEGGKKPGKNMNQCSNESSPQSVYPICKSARALRGTLISPYIPIVSNHKEIIQLSSATNRNMWEWD